MFKQNVGQGMCVDIGWQYDVAADTKWNQQTRVEPGMQIQRAKLETSIIRPQFKCIGLDACACECKIVADRNIIWRVRGAGC